MKFPKSLNLCRWMTRPVSSWYAPDRLHDGITDGVEKVRRGEYDRMGYGRVELRSRGYSRMEWVTFEYACERWSGEGEEGGYGRMVGVL